MCSTTIHLFRRVAPPGKLPPGHELNSLIHTEVLKGAQEAIFTASPDDLSDWMEMLEKERGKVVEV